MKYTFANIARALIVDCLFSWAIWAGWVQDVEGARNVVMLMIWFMFAVSLFCWADVMQEHMKDKPRKVPKWMSGIFWGAWILFLTWHGSWALAVAMVIAYINLSLVDPKRPVAAAKETAA